MIRAECVTEFVYTPVYYSVVLSTSGFDFVKKIIKTFLTSIRQRAMLAATLAFSRRGD